MNRAKLRDAAALFFLVLLVLFRFREGALLKVVYSLGDIGSEFLPIRVAAAEAFRRFDFLLWSPEIMGGYPTYAHPHTAVFYPVNWVLALVLPAWTTVNYFALLHFGLIACSMFVFLRYLGLSTLAGLLGAVVFALNGNRIYDSYLFLGPIAWLPLILLLFEKALATKDLRYLLLAALLNGLSGVAGSPPMTFVMNVGFLAYFVLRAFPRSSGSERARLGLALLAFFLISFGLTAVQALPTRELARLSSRSAPPFDFITAGSLPPEMLPRLVSGHAIEYLGIGAIGLGLLGLFGGRFRKTARFFGLITIIAVVLCLGKYTPVYRVLFAYFPGFDKFRIPLRFFVWVSFGVAALAAVGLDTLSDRLRRWPRGRTLAAAAATVVLAVIVFDYFRIPRYQYDPARATPAEEMREPVEVARPIDRTDGRYRVFPQYTKVDIWSPFSAKRQILEKDTPILAGVESVEGYMPLHYIPYMNMFNRLTVSEGSRKAILASFMNVGHVVTDADSPPGFPESRLPLRGVTRSGIRLFENPEALPRVQVGNALVVEPDPDRAVARLLEGEWEPGERLQVASMPPDLRAPCREPLRARVTRLSYGPTRIAIEATTNCAAVLCLRDTYYPGWKVAVDGETRPLLSVDVIYRGVELHPGTNRVLFRYQPASLLLGATISLITLAILGGALAAISRTRRLQKDPAARTSASVHHRRPTSPRRN